MGREALGRTYGLPIFFELITGETAIINKLNSSNYLVTVAYSPTPATALLRGSYVLAWSLAPDETRLHPDPLMITEACGFTFYNDNQNRLFEVLAPVADMAISLIPTFGTGPVATQAGPTTTPVIVIT